MASISLTFGDTVKSFPLLADNPSQKVQKEIRSILEQTKNEVLQRLRTPGRDYKDHTFTLRYGFRARRMAGYRYRVWNNTEYASFIENGTRYIKERKMLHREIYNGRQRLRRRLKALSNRIMQGDFL